MAVFKLALVDTNPDAIKLVEFDSEDTDVLSAVDSVPNAVDIAKLATFCSDIAADVEVESELMVDVRVTSSALNAVLSEESPTVSDDAAVLTVVDTAEMD